MSYILEALADSEQARQQVAAAPRHSLLSVVGEDTPRQRVWPYALAGAVLLNVAVLALWQRPASSGDAAPVKATTLPQAAPTVSQAAPTVPQLADAAAPEPRVAPQAESPKPAVAAAEIVLRETKLPPIQPERADDRRNARLSAPAVAIPGTVAVNSASDGAPMLKLSTPKTISKPRAEVALAKAAAQAEPKSAPAPAPIASVAAPIASVAAPVAPVAAAAPAQPAPATAGGTELPPTLQKEIPALSVAGFIHGEGSSSMVIVNDRLVREGDEVAPGVRLEKILGDNLVFNYKGYRFKR